MNLKEVRDILHAEVLCGEDMLDTEVRSACGSDFMSDVLAYVKNQALLLTGLVNPQVVRTAEMMDMKCIVFVRGKQPEENILELAQEVAEQLDSQVFQAKIHRGVGVAMAPAHGQTVLTYQPDSRPAQDFQAIIDAVGGDRFVLPKPKKGLKYISKFFN